MFSQLVCENMSVMLFTKTKNVDIFKAFNNKKEKVWNFH